MKRIALFLLTNVAVVVVLGIVASLLGVNRFLTSNGLNLGALLGFAFIMGFGGAITGVRGLTYGSEEHDDDANPACCLSTAPSLPSLPHALAEPRLALLLVWRRDFWCPGGLAIAHTSHTK